MNSSDKCSIISYPAKDMIKNVKTTFININVPFNYKGHIRSGDVIENAGHLSG